MIRVIKSIIVHCDANQSPHWGIPELRKLHEERGFGGIGYHFWIGFNGVLVATRPISIKGCHSFGHNEHSIGICLHGKDEFLIAQFDCLKRLIMKLMNQYEIPLSQIFPHNKFSSKSCPNFDLELIKNEIKKLTKVVYMEKSLEVIKAEVAQGIGGLVAVFDSIEALVECASKVSEDHKVGIDDIQYLVDLGKKYQVFVDMVKGLKSIPDEVKDLDREELVMLVKEFSDIIFKLKHIFIK